MTEVGGMLDMFDEHKSFKRIKQRSRKKLTLAQKVDVIRRYEQKCSLRGLALKFKCGRTQIKSILRNRNEHLRMWEQHLKEKAEGRTPTQPDTSDPVQVILGEWVKRARCYKINVTDDILRNFSQAIANHIGKEEFELTDEWITDFKQRNGFNSINIKQEIDDHKNNMKPLSIDIIIKDLGLDYAQNLVPLWKQNKTSTADRKKLTCKSLNERKMFVSIKQEDFAVQIDADGSTRNGFDFRAATEKQAAKEIENYKEALNHLGPLEQFVLLRENIRAVGLINQLENLFREEMEKVEI